MLYNLKPEDLESLSNSGIIDMASIQDFMKKRDREMLLANHPYNIWQGKNGYWYTYLPCDEGDGKRKLCKKRNRPDLEADLIVFWREKQDRGHTIGEIFEEIMVDRLNLKVNKKSTIDRHRATFKKHFSEFGQRYLKDVTAYDVEEFIKAQFSDGLDSKAWGRLHGVLAMILTHGRKKGWTKLRLEEIIEDMEYSPKNLMKQRKSDDSQEAYTLEEAQRIIGYIREHHGQLDLAVGLLFYTGMRVGELCTLRTRDIHDNEIVVTQALEHHKEDGHVVYGVQKPKTSAGVRRIIVMGSARWIIRDVKRLNPFGEYAFEKEGAPIKDAAVRDKLKYICDKLGIPYRSPHKIRKTYGTMLIDSNIPAKIVQQQMGHEDISTTMRYYYQDINNSDTKRRVIDEIESFKKLAQ